MPEILIALLANPGFQKLIEGVAVKCIAEIFHRRSIDPTYLTRSDAAFAAHATAKTDEEKTNALKQLQSLFASD